MIRPSGPKRMSQYAVKNGHPRSTYKVYHRRIGKRPHPVWLVRSWSPPSTSFAFLRVFLRAHRGLRDSPEIERFPRHGGGYIWETEPLSSH